MTVTLYVAGLEKGSNLYTVTQLVPGIIGLTQPI
jgi:hypothetical protein